jgi:hypothetical protein
MASNKNLDNTGLVPRDNREEALDLLELGRLLIRRWRLVVLSGAVPALLCFFVAKFVVTPEWGAVATVRPIDRQMQMQSFMGLGYASIMGSLGSASELLHQGMESDEAQEYTSILGSYDFTLQLIERHGLANHLLNQSPWYSPSRLLRSLTSALGSRQSSDATVKWKMYELMGDRFDCEFNVDTGNLELRFVDKDPEMAGKILAWYVSDLREMLRAQEIRSIRWALESLRSEAAKTADAYLQGQLYQLSAIQLQNLTMAGAESDFAFKVIQSPVVPSRPYSPRPVLDAAILGLAGAIAAVLWLVVGASLRERPAYDSLSPGSNDRERVQEAVVEKLVANRSVRGAKVKQAEQSTQVT